MQDSHKPLADRIRPSSLKEFVGQEHLVGKEGILRKLIESDQLTSLILWGPPGVGKTTLAEIIANATKSHFVSRSAVTTTLADVRKEVEEAKERLKTNQRTIFFLDEIHRFNKAQQDAFLLHVENGTIILIGATTENPSFEVIPALLSRCRVFVLNELSDKEMEKIIKRAGYPMDKESTDWLVAMANGDARQAIAMLENTYALYKKINVKNLA